MLALHDPSWDVELMTLLRHYDETVFCVLITQDPRVIERSKCPDLYLAGFRVIVIEPVYFGWPS
jgi:hypothetical protein